MNSIDGIIALCALLGAYGILLAAVNEQQNGVETANNSIKANFTALNCGAIIDSIYANSAMEYTKEINCKTETGKAAVTIGEKTKSFEIITNAKKTNKLEVQINEHYSK